MYIGQFRSFDYHWQNQKVSNFFVKKDVKFDIHLEKTFPGLKHNFNLCLDDEERAAAIAARKEEAKLKRRKKKKTASYSSLASNTFQVS